MNLKIVFASSSFNIVIVVNLSCIDAGIVYLHVLLLRIKFQISHSLSECVFMSEMYRMAWT